jgi:hypothetical protein
MIKKNLTLTQKNIIVIIVKKIKHLMKKNKKILTLKIKKILNVENVI